MSAPPCGWVTRKVSGQAVLANIPRRKLQGGEDSTSKLNARLRLCDHCTGTILTQLLGESSSTPFVLNDDHMRQILTTTDHPSCISCELIGNAFHLNSILALRERARPGYSGPPQVYSFPESDGITIRGNVEEEGEGRTYGTLKLSTDCAKVERPITISDTIDFKEVANWVDHCKSVHGPECGRRELSVRHSKIIDILLVDVLQECLCMKNTASQYFALSYVWGNTGITTTTSKSLSLLLQPGSLGPTAVLPKTVSDALALTRGLGMRYLWVDCLSIVQDSPEKHNNIANMDLIYAQAEATIVALNGRDADAGLAGIHPETRRRRTTTRTQGNHTITLDLPDDIRGLLDSTVYGTRGWTYQEMLLSKRLLFVTAHQVVFHCGTSRRSESLPDEEPHTNGHFGNSVMSIGHDEFLGNKSDMIVKSYNTMVSEYTTRRLSYQSDIENAFAGLGCVLEEWCKGSPVAHGMMTDTFSLAMMWYFPYSWFESSQYKPERTSSGRREGFPSWSWVGWISPIANFKSKLRSDFHLESLISDVKIKTFSRVITVSQTITVIDQSVRIHNSTELGQQLHITLEPVRLASDPTSGSLGFEAQRAEWSDFTIDADLNLEFLKNAFVFCVPGESEACGLLSIPLDKKIMDEVRSSTIPAIRGLWSLVRLYALRMSSEDKEYDNIRHLRDEIEDREVNGGRFERIPYPLRSQRSNLTLVFILLVRRQGQDWERMGSGFMYEDAWPSTSDRAKIRAHQERIVLV